LNRLSAGDDNPNKEVVERFVRQVACHSGEGITALVK
jgi:hypothetical protein